MTVETYPNLLWITPRLPDTQTSGKPTPPDDLYRTLVTPLPDTPRQFYRTQLCPPTRTRPEQVPEHLDSSTTYEACGKLFDQDDDQW